MATRKKPAPPLPLTPAQRARKYREKKAAQLKAAAAAALESPSEQRDEPAERDASRDAPPKTAPPVSMLDEINASIEAMKWLEASDKGAVGLARKYAGMIDDLLELDPMATGKAASLGQILMRILHELGGTPTVRLQHELRALRLVPKPDTEPGDEDADTIPVNKTGRPSTAAKHRSEATVTSITRPAKRRQRQA